ncbi:hypothetical protein JQ597_04590 [Bradyrhizobium sp. AUGA SZCCT0177]|uniref:hypothetical protein n=1 Tax=Bradyrhizobium sp. AUGA SZCCT0177 TaxID=2807665 RepID=UPI001BAB2432|nr:hypothetical protein [Bradyrhizobium sp. AUGA SZCCT0177]MBR1281313.1 hypothetical protein [Bradyrhizobium sp. AUGA SZCCT0177]
MSYDHSICIEKPEVALVKRADGEERVGIVLPIVSIPEGTWNKALDAAASEIADYLVQRGDHGRQFDGVKALVLLHHDRGTTSSWLARQMISRLNQQIRDEFEIDLDLQVENVKLSASGSFEMLVLTSRLQDAATIFNCNASIDPTKNIETLRNRTATLGQAEWGLLLDRLIRLLDLAREAEQDIYLAIFLKLERDGLVREAMLHGLDQKGLKLALYGHTPLNVDGSGFSVH